MTALRQQAFEILKSFPDEKLFILIQFIQTENLKSIENKEKSLIEILKKIRAEKSNLVAEKKIKAENSLPLITDLPLRVIKVS